MLPPTGTITLLFSDIEGSTRLWETEPLETDAALRQHDSILRGLIETHKGHIFKTVGDGFYASFTEPLAALESALKAQIALTSANWPTSRPIKVRMALHVGNPEYRDGDYFGPSMNRLARLLPTGYGGQILLSKAILEQVRDRLPELCSTRDLGLHRLKDLDAPEQVAMLVHPQLRDEFPALKSLDGFPNNLPRLLTSFVGHESSIKQLSQTILDQVLVTLVGTGGTGKSRLALQVAGEILERFQDGVWFVELAPISDPGLILQTIANAVGVRESPGMPLQRTLEDHLKDKRILLVLDNCEHLLAECARFVPTLLALSPELRILATSREPFLIPGENIFRVPSLATPDPRTIHSAESAMAFESIRLFVERGQLALPQFRLTEKSAVAAAQICRRLDGIPFAIELAATRLKVLSPEQIAERLDDRFRLLSSGTRTALPRQQTLRAMIDWSYDMLEDNEKTLLQRLGVFSGGWTLESAESVAADDRLKSWEVLDNIARLVDKSLVALEESDTEPRYRMLETVRQYSIEKLQATQDESATRLRHAQFFVNLGIEAEDGLLGPDQLHWLERLELEHGNLRAALRFCQVPERTDLGFAMVGAIGRFWTVRGYLTEGRDQIDALLAASADGATEAKANACRTAGQIAYWQGDSQAGRKYGEMSLEMCRELGDKGGETRSLFRLGFAALAEKDLPVARARFEEALKLGQEIDDKPGIPHLLNAMGEVSWAEGNNEEAHRYFENALRLFKGFGDRRSIASVMKNLAMLACDQDRFDEAACYLRDGLVIRQELQSETGIAVTLDCLGVLAARQGQFDRAVYLLAAAQKLHSAHGSQPEPSDAERIGVAKAKADEKLGRERFDLCWDRGNAAPLDEVLATADTEPAVVHATLE